MNGILRQVNKVILVAVFVALVCFPILWGTVWHVKVDNILQEWQANGPHTTMLGGLWKGLSAARWLGPLRPRPPRDPLQDCGVRGGKLVATRRLGNCLEKQMGKALQEHEDLTKKFFLAMFWVLYNHVHNVVMYWWRGRRDDRTREEKPVPQDTAEMAQEHPLNDSRTP